VPGSPEIGEVAAANSNGLNLDQNVIFGFTGRLLPFNYF
jgi:hypothetical protein